MGTLVLVRHGQASFGSADYDVLSEKGERQSRLLGEHWARRQIRFDAVFTGPRVRQIKTAEIVRAACSTLPEPVVMPELDEMAVEAVIKEHVPRLLAENTKVRELFVAFQSGGGRRSFQKLLEEVTAMWVHGEIETPGIEGWAEFKARVRGALATLTGGEGRGRRVVAFTSGGPIGATLQHVLGLTDELGAAQSWAVKNASTTELLFSGAKMTLSVFNALHHIDDPELETYR